MEASKKRELLRKFGEFAMVHLRDRAIEHAERTLAGKWAAPSKLRLQAELAKLTPAQRALVLRVVRCSIDAGIHDFLFAVSELEGANSVAITVEGVDVTSLSDGVYAEHVGTEGWEASFSRYGEAPEED